MTRAEYILESYDDVITNMMTRMDAFAKSVGGYLGRDRSGEAVRKDLSELLPDTLIHKYNNRRGTSVLHK